GGCARGSCACSASPDGATPRTPMRSWGRRRAGSAGARSTWCRTRAGPTRTSPWRRWRSTCSPRSTAHARRGSARLVAVLLHEIIELAASTCGDQVALVADGRRLTFGELEARIRHMSARIAELTDPGDRVVLVAENRLDAVTALYAVPRAGAQYAPANVRHTPEEIRDFIESIAPAVVLATPGQLDRVASQLEGLERAPEVLSIDGEHAAAKLDLTAALDDDAASGVPEEHHHVS